MHNNVKIVDASSLPPGRPVNLDQRAALDPSDECEATVCVVCADDAANGFEVLS